MDREPREATASSTNGGTELCFAPVYRAIDLLTVLAIEMHQMWPLLEEGTSLTKQMNEMTTELLRDVEADVRGLNAVFTALRAVR